MSYVDTGREREVDVAVPVNNVMRYYAYPSVFSLDGKNLCVAIFSSKSQKNTERAVEPVVTT